MGSAAASPHPVNLVPPPPRSASMPVNTSSTGATYGKSSDPLCPLGFHGQVRWPTRCKRCFRDYKEHTDSLDQKKFGDLGAKKVEEDPWSVRKTSFQKSRSVDVAMDGAGATEERPGEEGRRRSQAEKLWICPRHNTTFLI